MRKPTLTDAIVKFETSTRTKEDYMAFMIVVKNAFSQGNGMSGIDIQESLAEALISVRGESEKTPIVNELLAYRITDFLTTYGKRAAQNDEDDDVPVWSSPDASELEMAAEIIKLGGPLPRQPWSDWGSGGYGPYTSKEGRAEHDAILELIHQYMKK